MEHILVGCAQGTANLIWRLASEAWDHDTYQWPRISFGIALGCGNLTAKTHRPQDEEPEEPQGIPVGRRGVTRLLQILVSEATHLIWVLRCERVIQEKVHSSHEAEARWYKAINRRLTEDKITATKIKRQKHYTELVKATWENLLKKNSDPPHNWIQNSGVLVGRRAQQAVPINDRVL